jgi:hypothetical protein
LSQDNIIFERSAAGTHTEKPTASNGRAIHTTQEPMIRSDQRLSARATR